MIVDAETGEVADGQFRNLYFGNSKKFADGSVSFSDTFAPLSCRLRSRLLIVPGCPDDDYGTNCAFVLLRVGRQTIPANRPAARHSGVGRVVPYLANFVICPAAIALIWKQMRAMKMLPLLICAVLTSPPQSLSAQTGFTQIYAFGAAPDADIPGGLLRGPDGALYGLSASGGATGYGAVYRLQPPASPGAPWTESVLYSFTGPTGNGQLGDFTTAVFGPNGALYGITKLGGAYNTGAIFELQPPAAPGGPWIETDLCSFPGAYPISLLFGSDGTLYGTASGGAYGQGMVFTLSPPQSPGLPWTEDAIYNFTGTIDGSGPISLIAGPNGVLYGTTALGGPYNQGVFFQLSPPAKPRAAWIETVLYNFSNGIPNSWLYPILSFYSGGVIYGVINNGGTVIQLQPATRSSWTQTVLFSFPPNGTVLSSQLILRHGNLYGATDTRTGLGALGPGGDLFVLKKPAAPGGPWTEVSLHRFQKLDSPDGTIVFDNDGVIYGATTYSNAAPHLGYAYQVVLPSGN